MLIMEQKIDRPAGSRRSVKISSASAANSSPKSQCFISVLCLCIQPATCVDFLDWWLLLIGQTLTCTFALLTTVHSAYKHMSADEVYHCSHRHKLTLSLFSPTSLSIKAGNQIVSSDGVSHPSTSPIAYPLTSSMVLVSKPIFSPSRGMWKRWKRYSASWNCSARRATMRGCIALLSLLAASELTGLLQALNTNSSASVTNTSKKSSAACFADALSWARISLVVIIHCFLRCLADLIAGNL